MQQEPFLEISSGLSLIASYGSISQDIPSIVVYVIDITSTLPAKGTHCRVRYKDSLAFLTNKSPADLFLKA